MACELHFLEARTIQSYRPMFSRPRRASWCLSPLVRDGKHLHLFQLCRMRLGGRLGRERSANEIAGHESSRPSLRPSAIADPPTMRAYDVNAKFRKFISDLSDKFWLIPAMMVSVGIILAMLFVSIDRSGIISQKIIDGPYLYSGGGTGARTLLGAVVSSTIGVAGTVFSITIAALSLAAGQMGPRLLRNFTHDRGNQVTLGVFLGTFSYALMVLRSVRTQSEGEFVPHFSLSVSIFLAFVCVGTLVYFVGHMASRINVDTVIDLVSDDARLAINRLMRNRARTRYSLSRVASARHCRSHF